MTEDPSLIWFQSFVYDYIKSTIVRRTDLHWNKWIQVSPGFFHSLDNLLKVGFNEKTKKKLISARFGTRVTLEHICSGIDLCVSRVELSVVLTQRALDRALEDRKAVKLEIAQSVPQSLKDRQKALSQEVAKYQKHLREALQ